jgi:hypothetical protein
MKGIVRLAAADVLLLVCDAITNGPGGIGFAALKLIAQSAAHMAVSGSPWVLGLLR